MSYHHNLSDTDKEWQKERPRIFPDILPRINEGFP